jgi:hypothetical protein
MAKYWQYLVLAIICNESTDNTFLVISCLFKQFGPKMLYVFKNLSKYKVQQVFNLKLNPNYNSICRLWWHQYNRKTVFCCYFFVRSFVCFWKNLQNSFTHYSRCWKWSLHSQREASPENVDTRRYTVVWFDLSCQDDQLSFWATGVSSE